MVSEEILLHNIDPWNYNYTITRRLNPDFILQHQLLGYLIICTEHVIRITHIC